jgi:hypothetical protein
MAIRALKFATPFGPRAIVVANDTVYGLSCLFAVGLLGLLSINVFRNLHSAENWLDWRTELKNTEAAT